MRKILKEWKRWQLKESLADELEKSFQEALLEAERLERKISNLKKNIKEDDLFDAAARLASLSKEDLQKHTQYYNNYKKLYNEFVEPLFRKKEALHIKIERHKKIIATTTDVDKADRSLESIMKDNGLVDQVMDLVEPTIQAYFRLIFKLKNKGFKIDKYLYFQTIEFLEQQLEYVKKDIKETREFKNKENEIRNKGKLERDEIQKEIEKQKQIQKEMKARQEEIKKNLLSLK